MGASGNTYTLIPPADKFLVLVGKSDNDSHLPIFTNDFGSVSWDDLDMRRGYIGTYPQLFIGLYKGTPTANFHMSFSGDSFGSYASWMLLGVSSGETLQMNHTAYNYAHVGPPYAHPFLSWTTANNLVLRGTFTGGPGGTYHAGYVNASVDAGSSSDYAGVAAAMDTDVTSMTPVVAPTVFGTFTVVLSGTGAPGILPPPPEGTENPAPVGANVVPI
jgi:hypothetical protein